MGFKKDTHTESWRDYLKIYIHFGVVFERIHPEMCELCFYKIHKINHGLKGIHPKGFGRD